jgi:hypothetical protein
MSLGLSSFADRTEKLSTPRDSGHKSVMKSPAKSGIWGSFKNLSHVFNGLKTCLKNRQINEAP